MRPSIVWTILRREWMEIVRSRLLLSTILVPPVLLTVAPIILAGAVGDRALPAELVTQILEQIYFDVMGVRPGADGIEPGA